MEEKAKVKVNPIFVWGSGFFLALALAGISNIEGSTSFTITWDFICSLIFLFLGYKLK
jgi:hypothetical protein